MMNPQILRSEVAGEALCSGYAAFNGEAMDGSARGCGKVELRWVYRKGQRDFMWLYRDFFAAFYGFMWFVGKRMGYLWDNGNISANPNYYPIIQL